VEPPNRHLDIKSAHKRFSSRLDEFIRLSHAVVVAPGGIGTLLELMYVWQLLQLHTVEGRPVILIGREFWTGFLDWMREKVAGMGLVDARDLDCVSVVDTPEEALAMLDRSHAAFLAERQPPIADGASSEEALLQATEELTAELAAEIAVDLACRTELSSPSAEGLARAA
jgi:predicted Rossmann-fold nucleotide-binding protein